MINVQIDPQLENQVNQSIISNAAEKALSLVGNPDEVNLTILVSDDAQLQKLNKHFREIEEPTDVLSFPIDSPKLEGEQGYLGDIAISLERATAQAEAGGHSIQQELELLTVHGVLHLLGHDHDAEEEKQTMWALQQQALESMGNPLRPE